MDDIIERCGSFGRYQKLLLSVMGSVTVLCGFTQFMSVFNTASPAFSCHQKNDEEILSNTCEIFSNVSLSKESLVNSSYECQYSREYYGETIVTEWDLICDKISFANLTQTIYQIGSLSCFFVGFLSDQFGRKKVCLYMTFILCFSIAFSEIAQFEVLGLSSEIRFAFYLVSQYLNGFTIYALDTVTFILLVECTTNKHVNLISMINIGMYVLGELILAAVCFYFRNWRIHNWISAGFAFFMSFAVIGIAPESPRFLLVKNRSEEAAKILARIANFNGSDQKIIEEKLLLELEELLQNENEFKKLTISTMIVSRSDLNLNKSRPSIHLNQEVEEVNKTPNLLEYLTTPKKHAMYVALLAYIWTSITLMYFGLSFGITSISKNFNPYTMFISSSISEIIGYSFNLFGSKYSYRNKLGVYLFIAGCTCLPVALIPVSGETTESFSLNMFFTIVFCSLSKMFTSTCVFMLYLYSSRIFPTSVRNTLISYIGCFGRVGAVLAPQVNLLRYTVWGPLPFYILGANTILTSLTMLLLPNEQLIKHDI